MTKILLHDREAEAREKGGTRLDALIEEESVRTASAACDYDVYDRTPFLLWNRTRGEILSVTSRTKQTGAFRSDNLLHYLRRDWNFAGGNYLKLWPLSLSFFKSDWKIGRRAATHGQ